MKNKIILLLVIFIMFFPTIIYAKASNKQSENFANIVFFAYYTGTNEQMEEDIKYFTDNSQKLLNFYDGTARRSFTNYLNTVSYGKFNVKNIFPQVNNGVIMPIKLDMDIASSYERNNDAILIDTIINAYPDIRDIVDYNDDGFIDNITIIIKSRKNYTAVDNSTFISHKSDYPSKKMYLNKYVGCYNIVGTASIDNNESGVLVHEFLHTLGYPDLYRSENVDDYPVYTWDIMASANIGMSYPLAFLRSEISNWLDIETVTESRSLRLDLQTSAEGNQAYILKSPLNDYEFFVVEFRKKDVYDIGSLDRFIGDSGVIVYRVDTTVERFSNNHGKTGIYVFRPQSEFNDERTRVYNAYLSQEAGRTSIGTSDMSKGLQDGALTFSDGSNSGIIIKNVSSSKGEFMTLDVEIPNKEDFDLWTNTNLPDLVGNETVKNSNIIKYNNKIYNLSYTKDKLYTHVYENDTWIKLGNHSSIQANDFTVLKTVELNNNLYIVSSYTNKINVYKWNNVENKWNLSNSYTEDSTTNYIYEFDIIVINNVAYISSSTSDQAILYKLENENITKIKTYHNYDESNQYCGTPRIGNIGEDIYITTKLSSGNILAYKYKNDTFEEINMNINDITTNTYDLKSLNNKLYFVFDNKDDRKLILVTYDGNSTNIIKSNIELRFPNIVVSQGNLYVLGECNEKLYVFAFDEENETFTIEGNAVDVGNSSYNTSLEAIGHTVYVGIRKTDMTILVKKKEITNRLKTIEITEPTKRVYKIGEAIDETGLKVTAIYENGERVVNNYIISNFDTTNIGKYTAYVFYEGIFKTFEYDVIENKAPEENPSNPPTEEPGDKPSNPPVEEPGDKPSNPPVEEPAEQPSNPPTEKPEDKPSNPPVEEPGDKPGNTPTETPEVKPTNPPAETPEQKPEQKPTEQPTQKPTENSTATPSKKPNQTPTNVPTQKPSETPTNKPIEVTKPTLFNMSINNGFKIKSKFIHNFSLNTLIETIKNKFNNLIKVVTKNNIISTGTEISYNNEIYTTVIYGDLNGDGKINSADLLKMKQHLLETDKLTGAYREAANLTNDTIINSADLLRLRQHLLGTNTIIQ